MYATAADVKRVLGMAEDDVSRDTEITAALEAASEWIGRRIRKRYAAGSYVQSFWDVRDDALLQLKDEAAAVTTVVADEAVLTEWVLVGGVAVRLPGDGTIYYSLVSVTYVSAATVPKPIREATAMFAAKIMPPKPTVTGETPQVLEKKIGNFSVKFAKAVEEVEESGWTGETIEVLLKPYRRPRVRVI
jgi:hypothetical protein